MSSGQTPPQRGTSLRELNWRSSRRRRRACAINVSASTTARFTFTVRDLAVGDLQLLTQVML